MSAEEELIRRCAQGDAGAWKAFVDSYSGWLLRVARATFKRTGQAADADADDVVSEVFRLLLERDAALLRSFRAPFNLRAWLAVLARRTCLRHFRKKVHLPDPQRRPPEETFSQEERDTLRGLMDRLPPEDRALLEMFFARGCSYEEIAEILGISPESVGKRKFRALEKLRQWAKEQGFDPRGEAARDRA